MTSGRRPTVGGDGRLDPTSHPAGARRKTTTRRRPAQRRKPAARRRPAVAGSGRRRRGERRAGTPKRLWPALLLAAAVLVGVAWDSRGHGSARRCPDTAPSPDCRMTLTAEQVANAATIAAGRHATEGCPSGPS